MSIFDNFRRDRYDDDYDDGDELYDDIDAEDDDDEGVSRFATSSEGTSQSRTQRSTHQSSYTGHTAPESGHRTAGGNSYQPSSSGYHSSGAGYQSSSAGYQSSSYAGSPSYNASNLHKVNTSASRRKVEELYMADLKDTSDALAVADLVKEKRFALIVNLNPLKAEGSNGAYSSVINFIDGVCYVTDTEFKEINSGSGLFLIYHKDIILNEGFSGFTSATTY